MSNYIGTQVLTDVGWGEDIRQLGEAETQWHLKTLKNKNAQKMYFKRRHKIQQQAGVIQRRGK